MRLSEVKVGDHLVLSNVEGIGRRHRHMEGREVVVTGVLRKDAGLADVRGHVQGVLIADVAGIAFKASRFTPVVAPPPAAAVEAPQVATPVTSPDATGDASAPAPAVADSGAEGGPSLADA